MGVAAVGSMLCDLAVTGQVLYEAADVLLSTRDQAVAFRLCSGHTAALPCRSLCLPVHLDPTPVLVQVSTTCNHDAEQQSEPGLYRSWGAANSQQGSCLGSPALENPVAVRQHRLTSRSLGQGLGLGLDAGHDLGVRHGCLHSPVHGPHSFVQGQGEGRCSLRVCVGIRRGLVVQM